MEDQNIVELFNSRSENAIAELLKKYGRRCLYLSENILENRQDAEEVVNDAARVLWERIPPEQPEYLWAYLSRVLRNLAYSRRDYLNAAKRDRGCEVYLSELEGCLATVRSVESVLESRKITEIINAYLAMLDKTSRVIFVRRYYYFDSCADIGKRVGMTRGAVNTRLHRLRAELRKMLEKEEIFV